MSKYDFDRVVTTTAWSPGPGCHGGCGVKLYIKDEKVDVVDFTLYFLFRHGLSPF